MELSGEEDDEEEEEYEEESDEQESDEGPMEEFEEEKQVTEQICEEVWVEPEEDPNTKYPKIDVEKNADGRIVYRFPRSVSARFTEIFAKVDADPAAYGIKSYSVRVQMFEEGLKKLFVQAEEQSKTLDESQEEDKESAEDQENSQNTDEGLERNNNHGA